MAEIEDVFKEVKMVASYDQRLKSIEHELS